MAPTEVVALHSKLMSRVVAREVGRGGRNHKLSGESR